MFLAILYNLQYNLKNITNKDSELDFLYLKIITDYIISRKNKQKNQLIF